MLKRLFMMACFMAGMGSMAACGKIGVGGRLNSLVGNWAEVSLPVGCTAKQIASSSDHGVAVLCEDGHVFH